MAERKPNVVGLDLSLTASGVASSAGWCKVVGKDGVTTLPLLDRLRIVDHLTFSILDLVGTPDLVVVEVPAFSRASTGALERSALWWNVAHALAGREVPLAEVFNNTRMRYATGRGTASKSMVVDAVARRWPMYTTGGDDNLADAVVLCAMGMDHLGHPLAAMPATHRAALGAVVWPELAVADVA